ncbi:MAG: polyprotein [Hangzhou flavivirus 1]|nr:MAG: polyprotein [Hangzhou flavivirus 1]
MVSKITSVTRSLYKFVVFYFLLSYTIGFVKGEVNSCGNVGTDIVLSNNQTLNWIELRSGSCINVNNYRYHVKGMSFAHNFLPEKIFLGNPQPHLIQWKYSCSPNDDLRSCESMISEYHYEHCISFTFSGVWCKERCPACVFNTNNCVKAYYKFNFDTKWYLYESSYHSEQVIATVDIYINSKYNGTISWELGKYNSDPNFELLVANIPSKSIPKFFISHEGQVSDSYLCSRFSIKVCSSSITQDPLKLVNADCLSLTANWIGDNWSITYKKAKILDYLQSNCEYANIKSWTGLSTDIAAINIPVDLAYVNLKSKFALTDQILGKQCLETPKLSWSCTKGVASMWMASMVRITLINGRGCYYKVEVQNGEVSGNNKLISGENLLNVWSREANTSILVVYNDQQFDINLDGCFSPYNSQQIDNIVSHYEKIVNKAYSFFESMLNKFGFNNVTEYLSSYFEGFIGKLFLMLLMITIIVSILRKFLGLSFVICITILLLKPTTVKCSQYALMTSKISNACASRGTIYNFEGSTISAEKTFSEWEGALSKGDCISMDDGNFQVDAIYRRGVYLHSFELINDVNAYIIDWHCSEATSDVMCPSHTVQYHGDASQKAIIFDGKSSVCEIYCSGLISKECCTMIIQINPYNRYACFEKDDQFDFVEIEGTFYNSSGEYKITLKSVEDIFREGLRIAEVRNSFSSNKVICGTYLKHYEVAFFTPTLQNYDFTKHCIDDLSTDWTWAQAKGCLDIKIEKHYFVKNSDTYSCRVRTKNQLQMPHWDRVTVDDNSYSNGSFITKEEINNVRLRLQSNRRLTQKKVQWCVEPECTIFSEVAHPSARRVGILRLKCSSDCLVRITMPYCTIVSDRIIKTGQHVDIHYACGFGGQKELILEASRNITLLVNNTIWSTNHLGVDVMGVVKYKIGQFVNDPSSVTANGIITSAKNAAIALWNNRNPIDWINKTFGLSIENPIVLLNRFLNFSWLRWAVIYVGGCVVVYIGLRQRNWLLVGAAMGAMVFYSLTTADAQPIGLVEPVTDHIDYIQKYFHVIECLYMFVLFLGFCVIVYVACKLNNTLGMLIATLQIVIKGTKAASIGNEAPVPVPTDQQTLFTEINGVDPYVACLIFIGYIASEFTVDYYFFYKALISERNRSFRSFVAVCLEIFVVCIMIFIKHIDYLHVTIITIIVVLIDMSYLLYCWFNEYSNSFLEAFLSATTQRMLLCASFLNVAVIAIGLPILDILVMSLFKVNAISVVAIVLMFQMNIGVVRAENITSVIVENSDNSDWVFLLTIALISIRLLMFFTSGNPLANIFLNILSIIVCFAIYGSTLFNVFYNMLLSIMYVVMGVVYVLAYVKFRNFKNFSGLILFTYELFYFFCQTNALNFYSEINYSHYYVIVFFIGLIVSRSENHYASKVGHFTMAISNYISLSSGLNIRNFVSSYKSGWVPSNVYSRSILYTAVIRNNPAITFLYLSYACRSLDADLPEDFRDVVCGLFLSKSVLNHCPIQAGLYAILLLSPMSIGKILICAICFEVFSNKISYLGFRSALFALNDLWDKGLTFHNGVFTIITRVLGDLNRLIGFNNEFELLFFLSLMGDFIMSILVVFIFYNYNLWMTIIVIVVMLFLRNGDFCIANFRNPCYQYNDVYNFNLFLGFMKPFIPIERRKSLHKRVGWYSYDFSLSMKSFNRDLIFRCFDWISIVFIIGYFFEYYSMGFLCLGIVYFTSKKHYLDVKGVYRLHRVRKYYSSNNCFLIMKNSVSRKILLVRAKFLSLDTVVLCSHTLPVDLDHNTEMLYSKDVTAINVKNIVTTIHDNQPKFLYAKGYCSHGPAGEMLFGWDSRNERHLMISVDDIRFKMAIFDECDINLPCDEWCGGDSDDEYVDFDDCVVVSSEQYIDNMEQSSLEIPHYNDYLYIVKSDSVADIKKTHRIKDLPTLMNQYKNVEVKGVDNMRNRDIALLAMHFIELEMMNNYGEFEGDYKSLSVVLNNQGLNLNFIGSFVNIFHLLAHYSVYTKKDNDVILERLHYVNKSPVVSFPECIKASKENKYDVMYDIMTTYQMGEFNQNYIASILTILNDNNSRSNTETSACIKIIAMLCDDDYMTSGGVAFLKGINVHNAKILFTFIRVYLQEKRPSVPSWIDKVCQHLGLNLHVIKCYTLAIQTKRPSMTNVISQTILRNSIIGGSNPANKDEIDFCFKMTEYVGIVPASECQAMYAFSSTTSAIGVTVEEYSNEAVKGRDEFVQQSIMRAYLTSSFVKTKGFKIDLRPGGFAGLIGISTKMAAGPCTIRIPPVNKFYNVPLKNTNELNKSAKRRSVTLHEGVFYIPALSLIGEIPEDVSNFFRTLRTACITDIQISTVESSEITLSNIAKFLREKFITDTKFKINIIVSNELAKAKILQNMIDLNMIANMYRLSDNIGCSIPLSNIPIEKTYNTLGGANSSITVPFIDVEVRSSLCNNVVDIGSLDESFQHLGRDKIYQFTFVRGGKSASGFVINRTMFIPLHGNPMKKDIYLPTVHNGKAIDIRWPQETLEMEGREDTLKSGPHVLHHSLQVGEIVVVINACLNRVAWLKVGDLKTAEEGNIVKTFNALTLLHYQGSCLKEVPRWSRKTFRGWSGCPIINNKDEIIGMWHLTTEVLNDDLSCKTIGGTVAAVKDSKIARDYFAACIDILVKSTQVYDYVFPVLVAPTGTGKTLKFAVQWTNVSGVNKIALLLPNRDNAMNAYTAIVSCLKAINSDILKEWNIILDIGSELRETSTRQQSGNADSSKSYTIMTYGKYNAKMSGRFEYDVVLADECHLISNTDIFYFHIWASTHAYQCMFSKKSWTLSTSTFIVGMTATLEGIFWLWPYNNELAKNLPECPSGNINTEDRQLMSSIENSQEQQLINIVNSRGSKYYMTKEHLLLGRTLVFCARKKECEEYKKSFESINKQWLAANNVQCKTWYKGNTCDLMQLPEFCVIFCTNVLEQSVNIPNCCCVVDLGTYLGEDLNNDDLRIIRDDGSVMYNVTLKPKDTTKAMSVQRKGRCGREGQLSYYWSTNKPREADSFNASCIFTVAFKMFSTDLVAASIKHDRLRDLMLGPYNSVDTLLKDARYPNRAKRYEFVRKYECNFPEIVITKECYSQRQLDIWFGKKCIDELPFVSITVHEKNEFLSLITVSDKEHEYGCVNHFILTDFDNVGSIYSNVDVNLKVEENCSNMIQAACWIGAGALCLGTKYYFDNCPAKVLSMKGITKKNCYKNAKTLKQHYGDDSTKEMNELWCNTLQNITTTTADVRRVVSSIVVKDAMGARAARNTNNSYQYLCSRVPADVIDIVPDVVKRWRDSMKKGGDFVELPNHRYHEVTDLVDYDLRSMDWEIKNTEVWVLLPKFTAFSYEIQHKGEDTILENIELFLAEVCVHFDRVMLCIYNDTPSLRTLYNLTSGWRDSSTNCSEPTVSGLVIMDLKEEFIRENFTKVINKMVRVGSNERTNALDLMTNHRWTTNRVCTCTQEVEFRLAFLSMVEQEPLPIFDKFNICSGEHAAVKLNISPNVQTDGHKLCLYGIEVTNYPPRAEYVMAANHCYVSAEWVLSYINWCRSQKGMDKVSDYKFDQEFSKAFGEYTIKLLIVVPDKDLNQLTGGLIWHTQMPWLVEDIGFIPELVITNDPKIKYFARNWIDYKNDNCWSYGTERVVIESLCNWQSKNKAIENLKNLNRQGDFEKDFNKCKEINKIRDYAKAAVIPNNEENENNSYRKRIADIIECLKDSTLDVFTRAFDKNKCNVDANSTADMVDGFSTICYGLGTSAISLASNAGSVLGDSVKDATSYGASMISGSVKVPVEMGAPTCWDTIYSYGVASGNAVMGYVNPYIDLIKAVFVDISERLAAGEDLVEILRSYPVFSHCTGFLAVLSIVGYVSIKKRTNTWTAFVFLLSSVIVCHMIAPHYIRMMRIFGFLVAPILFAYQEENAIDAVRDTATVITALGLGAATYYTSHASTIVGYHDSLKWNPMTAALKLGLAISMSRNPTRLMDKQKQSMISVPFILGRAFANGGCLSVMQIGVAGCLVALIMHEGPKIGKKLNNYVNLILSAVRSNEKVDVKSAMFNDGNAQDWMESIVATVLYLTNPMSLITLSVHIIHCLLFDLELEWIESYKYCAGSSVYELAFPYVWRIVDKYLINWKRTNLIDENAMSSWLEAIFGLINPLGIGSLAHGAFEKVKAGYIRVRNFLANLVKKLLSSREWKKSAIRFIKSVYNTICTVLKFLMDFVYDTWSKAKQVAYNLGGEKLGMNNPQTDDIVEVVENVLEDVVMNDFSCIPDMFLNVDDCGMFKLVNNSYRSQVASRIALLNQGEITEVSDCPDLDISPWIKLIVKEGNNVTVLEIKGQAEYCLNFLTVVASYKTMEIAKMVPGIGFANYGCVNRSGTTWETFSIFGYKCSMVLKKNIRMVIDDDRLAKLRAAIILRVESLSITIILTCSEDGTWQGLMNSTSKAVGTIFIDSLFSFGVSTSGYTVLRNQLDKIKTRVDINVASTTFPTRVFKNLLQWVKPYDNITTITSSSLNFRTRNLCVLLALRPFYLLQERVCERMYTYEKPKQQMVDFLIATDITEDYYNDSWDVDFMYNLIGNLTWSKFCHERRDEKLLENYKKDPTGFRDIIVVKRGNTREQIVKICPKNPSAPLYHQLWYTTMLTNVRVNADIEDINKLACWNYLLGVSTFDTVNNTMVVAPNNCDCICIVEEECLAFISCTYCSLVVVNKSLTFSASAKDDIVNILDNQFSDTSDNYTLNLCENECAKKTFTYRYIPEGLTMNSNWFNTVIESHFPYNTRPTPLNSWLIRHPKSFQKLMVGCIAKKTDQLAAETIKDDRHYYSSYVKFFLHSINGMCSYPLIQFLNFTDDRYIDVHRVVACISLCSVVGHEQLGEGIVDYLLQPWSVQTRDTVSIQAAVNLLFRRINEVMDLISTNINDSATSAFEHIQASRVNVLSHVKRWQNNNWSLIDDDSELFERRGNDWILLLRTLHSMKVKLDPIQIAHAVTLGMATEGLHFDRERVKEFVNDWKFCTVFISNDHCEKYGTCICSGIKAIKLKIVENLNKFLIEPNSKEDDDIISLLINAYNDTRVSIVQSIDKLLHSDSPPENYYSVDNTTSDIDVVTFFNPEICEPTDFTFIHSKYHNIPVKSCKVGSSLYVSSGKVLQCFDFLNTTVTVTAIGHTENIDEIRASINQRFDFGSSSYCGAGDKMWRDHFEEMGIMRLPKNDGSLGFANSRAFWKMQQLLQTVPHFFENISVIVDPCSGSGGFEEALNKHFSSSSHNVVVYYSTLTLSGRSIPSFQTTNPDFRNLTAIQVTNPTINAKSGDIRDPKTREAYHNALGLVSEFVHEEKTSVVKNIVTTNFVRLIPVAELGCDETKTVELMFYVTDESLISLISNVVPNYDNNINWANRYNFAYTTSMDRALRGKLIVILHKGIVELSPVGKKRVYMLLDMLIDKDVERLNYILRVESHDSPGCDLIMFDMGEVGNKIEDSVMWWFKEAYGCSIAEAVCKFRNMLRPGGKMLLKMNAISPTSGKFFELVFSNFESLRAVRLASCSSYKGEFYVLASGYGYGVQTPQSLASFLVSVHDCVYSQLSLYHETIVHIMKRLPKDTTRSSLITHNINFLKSYLDENSVERQMVLANQIPTWNGWWSASIKHKVMDKCNRKPMIFNHSIRTAIETAPRGLSINFKYGAGRFKKGVKIAAAYDAGSHLEKVLRKVVAQRKRKNTSIHNIIVPPSGDYEKAHQMCTIMDETRSARIQHNEVGYIAKPVKQVLCANAGSLSVGWTQNCEEDGEWRTKFIKKRLDTKTPMPKEDKISLLWRSFVSLETLTAKQCKGKLTLLSEEKVMEVINHSGSGVMIDEHSKIQDYMRDTPNWYEHCVALIKDLAKTPRGEVPITSDNLQCRQKKEPKLKSFFSEDGKWDEEKVNEYRSDGVLDVEKTKSLVSRGIEFSSIEYRLVDYILLGALYLKHNKGKLYKGSISGVPTTFTGRIMSLMFNMNNPKDMPTNDKLLATIDSMLRDEIAPDFVESGKSAAGCLDFSSFDATVSVADKMLIIKHVCSFYPGALHRAIEARLLSVTYSLTMLENGDVLVKEGRTASGEFLTSYGNTLIAAGTIRAGIASMLNVPIEQLNKTTREIITRVKHISSGSEKMNLVNLNKASEIFSDELERNSKPALRCNVIPLISWLHGNPLDSGLSGYDLLKDSMSTGHFPRLNTSSTLSELDELIENKLKNKMDFIIAEGHREFILHSTTPLIRLGYTVETRFTNPRMIGNPEAIVVNKINCASILLIQNKLEVIRKCDDGNGMLVEISGVKARILPRSLEETVIGSPKSNNEKIKQLVESGYRPKIVFYVNYTHTLPILSIVHDVRCVSNWIKVPEVIVTDRRDTFNAELEIDINKNPSYDIASKFCFNNEDPCSRYGFIHTSFVMPSPKNYDIISIEDAGHNKVYLSHLNEKVISTVKVEEDKHKFVGYPTEYDFVLYACPNSGKTTWNKDRFYDIDEAALWLEQPKTIITSVPQFENVKAGVAILPSKEVFEDRCKRRGLTVGNDWYSGLISSLSKNKQIKVIPTDAYISNIPDIEELVSQNMQFCRKREVTHPVINTPTNVIIIHPLQHAEYIKRGILNYEDCDNYCYSPDFCVTFLHSEEIDARKYNVIRDKKIIDKIFKKIVISENTRVLTSNHAEQELTRIKNLVKGVRKDTIFNIVNLSLYKRISISEDHALGAYRFILPVADYNCPLDREYELDNPYSHLIISDKNSRTIAGKAMARICSFFSSSIIGVKEVVIKNIIDSCENCVNDNRLQSWGLLPNQKFGISDNCKDIYGGNLKDGIKRSEFVQTTKKFELEINGLNLQLLRDEPNTFNGKQDINIWYPYLDSRKELEHLKFLSSNNSVNFNISSEIYGNNFPECVNVIYTLGEEDFRSRYDNYFLSYFRSSGYDQYVSDMAALADNEKCIMIKIKSNDDTPDFLKKLVNEFVMADKEVINRSDHTIIYTDDVLTRAKLNMAGLSDVDNCSGNFYHTNKIELLDNCRHGIIITENSPETLIRKYLLKDNIVGVSVYDNDYFFEVLKECVANKTVIWWPLDKHKSTDVGDYPSETFKNYDVCILTDDVSTLSKHVSILYSDYFSAHSCKKIVATTEAKLYKQLRKFCDVSVNISSNKDFPQHDAGIKPMLNALIDSYSESDAKFERGKVNFIYATNTRVIESIKRVFGSDAMDYDTWCSNREKIDKDLLCYTNKLVVVLHSEPAINAFDSEYDKYNRFSIMYASDTSPESGKTIRFSNAVSLWRFLYSNRNIDNQHIISQMSLMFNQDFAILDASDYKFDVVRVPRKYGLTSLKNMFDSHACEVEDLGWMPNDFYRGQRVLLFTNSIYADDDISAFMTKFPEYVLNKVITINLFDKDQISSISWNYGEQEAMSYEAERKKLFDKYPVMDFKEAALKITTTLGHVPVFDGDAYKPTFSGCLLMDYQIRYSRTVKDLIPKSWKCYEVMSFMSIHDGDDGVIFSNDENIKRICTFLPTWCEDLCKKLRSGNKTGINFVDKFEEVTFCSHLYTPAYVGQQPITPKVNEALATLVDNAITNNLKLYILPNRSYHCILSKLVATIHSKYNKFDKTNADQVAAIRGRILSALIRYPHCRYIRIITLRLLASLGGSDLIRLDDWKRTILFPNITSANTSEVFSIPLKTAIQSLYEVDSLDEIGFCSSTWEERQRTQIVKIHNLFRPDCKYSPIIQESSLVKSLNKSLLAFEVDFSVLAMWKKMNFRLKTSSFVHANNMLNITHPYLLDVDDTKDTVNLKKTVRILIYHKNFKKGEEYGIIPHYKKWEKGCNYSIAYTDDPKDFLSCQRFVHMLSLESDFDVFGQYKNSLIRTGRITDISAMLTDVDENDIDAVMALIEDKMRLQIGEYDSDGSESSL